MIEEDPRDRAVLAAMLRAFDCDVEKAATAAHALSRAGRRRFDAVAVGPLAPDPRGLEPLGRLRRAGAPVLLAAVTADRPAAAGFPVADLIAKPAGQRVIRDALLRAGVRPGRDDLVLLVDEEPAALRAAGAALDALGCQALCCPDPDLALRAIGSAAPVAMLVDVFLPGLGGLGFLQRARRARGRALPAIVWTSGTPSHDQRALLRASADEVVRARGAGALAEELRAALPRLRAV